MDVGQTARPPRAGVAGGAAVLTLRTIPCGLAALAACLPLLLHDAEPAIVLMPAALTAFALFSWSYVRAVRDATGGPVARARRPRFRSPPRQTAAATPDLRIPPSGTKAIGVALWLVPSAALGFGVAGLDSIAAPYRAAAVAVLLLGGVWFGHAAALRRIRAEAPAPRSPITERVDLVVEPSAALRNTTAQGRMMSVLGTRAAGLSDRELEIMDWCFAFGVAWAVARDQDPAAPDELVSVRALDVTRAVFDAYRGRPAPALNGARLNV